MHLPCTNCSTLVYIPPKYRRKGMKQSTCNQCIKFDATHTLINYTLPRISSAHHTHSHTQCYALQQSLVFSSSLWYIKRVEGRGSRLSSSQPNCYRIAKTLPNQLTNTLHCGILKEWKTRVSSLAHWELPRRLANPTPLQSARWLTSLVNRLTELNRKTKLRVSTTPWQTLSTLVY